ncbi:DedA family protein [Bacillus testis]|uniref:DedA family protein n=1 Tax=Bacillus testis TaxID=1622072 RepID=UPI00067EC98D|nr:DedA family protein [Bacillus testis]
MLHTLLDVFKDAAFWLIDTFGHMGIFLGMLIESACIPLPSEVIMLFGGFMAELGKLNFWLVVTAGVAGNLVGSWLAFYVGKKGGRPLILKYGKYIFLNVNHLEKSEHFFSKYGSATVFFGRVLPVIRTFISLPAGIANMSFRKFTVYTVLGCIPWNILLTYIGYKLGQNWMLAEHYMKPITYIIAVIVVVFVIYLVVKILRDRKRQAD